jgi:hypothetical protein
MLPLMILVMMSEMMVVMISNSYDDKNYGSGLLDDDDGYDGKIKDIDTDDMSLISFVIELIMFLVMVIEEDNMIVVIYIVCNCDNKQKKVFGDDDDDDII